MTITKNNPADPAACDLAHPVYYVLLLFLVVCYPYFSSLTANPSVPEMQFREAAAFTELQSYPQAASVYQELLQQNLTTWQEAATIYNMGLVFLKEGDSEKAITALKAVPVDDAPSPLLLYYTKINLALAYLQKGIAASHPLFGKTDKTSLQQAKDALNAALNALDEAEKAHCRLEKVEGVTSCSPSEEINQLRAAVQRQLASIYLQQENSTIAQSPLRLGLLLLFSLLNNARAQDSFLQQEVLKEPLKQHYRDFFVRDVKFALPLWDSLNAQMLKNPHEDQRKLYKDAKSAFAKALELMEQGHWKESQEIFGSALEKVQELIKLLPPEPPKPVPEPSQPSSEVPQGKAKVQEKGPSSMDHVLRLLIQMNQEDMLQQASSSVPEKEGVRPW